MEQEDRVVILAPLLLLHLLVMTSNLNDSKHTAGTAHCHPSEKVHIQIYLHTGSLNQSLNSSEYFYLRKDSKHQQVPPYLFTAISLLQTHHLHFPLSNLSLHHEVASDKQKTLNFKCVCVCVRCCNWLAFYVDLSEQTSSTYLLQNQLHWLLHPSHAGYTFNHLFISMHMHVRPFKLFA